MRGLLLAGGHGTRLRPLTFTGNKHMLPIANRPMLQYGLEHLINSSITDIGIILGPIKEGVVEYFGDGQSFGANITYIDQSEPKGLAHAIMVAEDFLQGEPFVMYLGDNLLHQGAKPLVDIFKDREYDFVGGITKVPDPSRYGVVVFKEDGSIEKLVEKPKKHISDWALIGLYVFNEKVFDAVKKIRPSDRGEYEITDTIQTMLLQGANIHTQEVKGWWKDTGKPEDLLEANQLILHEIVSYNYGRIQDETKVNNRVGIGKNTKIDGDVNVRGPAIIGENCVIGPNTYIGPYTSIGDDTVILNTEIERSIIMEGSYIDCGKRITDSIIGRKVIIKDSNQNLPKGHKLILGDQSTVTL